MTSTVTNPDQLDRPQQDIIVAAMEDCGRFEIAHRSDTRGKAVRTKHEKFFDADDKEFARTYVKAVPALERLLLVREAGKRDHYELTNFGWLMGRKLQQARTSSPKPSIQE